MNHGALNLPASAGDLQSRPDTGARRAPGAARSAAGSAAGSAAAILAAALVLGACGPAEGGAGAGAATPDRAAPPAPENPTDDRTDPAATARVALGVDVLLRDSVHMVRGRRVGLITNHTGLSWPEGEAVSTIDRLAASPGVELVALFSPEHGIRGVAEAGEKVASETDAATGLPIHSLYGDTRAPTPAMLDGLDALVFDIQDVGSRYYTYVWTMALAMEAAGEAGIPFVVLDRPNPIGGHRVQGNVLEREFRTFVGLHAVPMRHGLTVGELARMLVGEFAVEVDLAVAPMEGWTRTTWYDDTDLPFVPPSPNMPSLASATHYPGTCLFEGTNLSVGRGTDRAFQQIGAPWLDAHTVARRLNDRVGSRAESLQGVRFEMVTFTPRAPGDGKFGGEEVRAIRLVVTDRDRYDPTRAAIAMLVEIQRAHADRLEWHVAHFDRLAGTDRVRKGILAGEGLERVTAGWSEQARAFDAARAPYLLYP